MFWLLFAALCNYPWSAESLAEENADFAFVAVIGWPIPYLWHDFDGSGRFTTSWQARWMIANIAIFLVIEGSIVYGLQALNRFTLRTMMTVTAVVAAAIVLGRSLPGGGMTTYYYLMVLYFSPILIPIPLWFARRQRRAVPQPLDC